MCGKCSHCCFIDLAVVDRQGLRSEIWKSILLQLHASQRYELLSEC